MISTFIKCTVFSAMLLSSAISQANQESQKSYNVLVIGDSRTDAVFSNSRLGQKRNFLSGIQERVLGFVFGPLLFASLPVPEDGEFATSRPHMKRVQKIFSRKQDSGVLGTKPSSLPSLLANYLDRPVKILDFAEPGMTFQVAASEYVDEVVEKVAAKDNKPDLILLELGGVDFLVGVSSEEFGLTVVKTFDVLVSTFPNADIVISGIPDIVRLYKEGDQVATYAPDGSIFNTCHDVYEDFGLGLQLGLSRDADDAAYEAQYRRLAEMNRIVKDKLNSINDLSTIKGYQGRAAFSPAPVPEKLSEVLAFDCLHPNLLGQELTAEAFFETIRDELLIR